MATQSPSRLMLYAAISAVETDLRNFIATHTPSEDPVDFLGPQLHTKCLERAAQEAATLSSATIDDLLPYVDFADHFEIINRHRDLFPGGVASHIKDVTPKLERLAAIRNRVMHSRPLHGADFPTTFEIVESFDKARIGPWEEVRDLLKRILADPAHIYDLRIPLPADVVDQFAHNLPTPDFDETGFIGRTDFLQETIDAILGPYPVITILGAGGIGKSAVALKAAYDILDTVDCPFDLIIWSSSKTHALTGAAIRQINDSIASSLDLFSDVADDLGGVSDGDPIDRLVEDLATLPTLLILDNLETVLDHHIRSFLGRLPRGSKVLVTSRIGIGAYEHPLQLEEMNSDDTLSLMRTLARVRQVEDLVQCSNKQLRRYTARLYNNPGFIKWFVAGVQAGIRPEELLANPDAFLDFCLSNVYDYLSADAKAALRCLVPLRRASQADIGYYSELDGLPLTEAINDLMRTNIVSAHFIPERETYDTYYQVTEIAAQYLTKHHPISSRELTDIKQKRRQIIAVQEKIQAVGRRDPYQRTAIVLRSDRDLVPAKYLRKALRFSRRGEPDAARAEVRRAARVSPEYFEVHRVEGVVLAEAGEVFEADAAYRRALELRPDYGPLLYGYSYFLMRYGDDVQRAAELAAKALEIDPERSVVMVQLGRTRLYLEDYEGAREVLKPLQAQRGQLSLGDAKKGADLYLQTFIREGDLAVHQGRSLDGLRALERGHRFWKTIPEPLIDRRLRERLIKGSISAAWMVEEMKSKFPHEVHRATAIHEWLRSGGLPTERTSDSDRSGHDVVYGKVASLPVRERFGFLEADDGREIFFHRTCLEDRSGWAALSIGATVSFRVGSDEDGRLRATDVRIERPGHVIRNKEGLELEGIVESLVRRRGFGFVRAFAGPSYFVHRSFVREWDALEEGVRVSFVVGINPEDGNICARNLEVL